jgi:hypothetical protein
VEKAVRAYLNLLCYIESVSWKMEHVFQPLDMFPFPANQFSSLGGKKEDHGNSLSIFLNPLSSFERSVSLPFRQQVLFSVISGANLFHYRSLTDRNTFLIAKKGQNTHKEFIVP